MTKRALIIGGGIAGPLTAMALQKTGLEAVVHEAYDYASDGVGAFLTLAPNGLAALRELGIHETVAGLGIDTPRMEMLNGRGKRLGSVSSPARTLRRADLYAALRDEAVRRGIRIEYGKRLVGAAPSGHGVSAAFEDGTTAEGDLLIGADGLRSRTRTIIDPAAPRPRHLGLLNTGGFSSPVDVPGEPGVAYFLFGRQCFFGYVKQPDNTVWWFANPPSPGEPTPQQLAAITQAQARDRLNALFAGDTGPMLPIIEATEHIIPLWNTYDLPTVPRWHNQRMILVGDAAHATSPSSGQGASMAIEDAVALGMCLRDAPEPQDAFAAFERLRRTRVERVVAQGKRNGDGKAPGVVGAAVRDLMMPFIMRQVDKRNAMGWITDYRLSWSDQVA